MSGLRNAVPLPTPVEASPAAGAHPNDAAGRNDASSPSTTLWCGKRFLWWTFIKIINFLSPPHRFFARHSIVTKFYVMGIAAVGATVFATLITIKRTGWLPVTFVVIGVLLSVISIQAFLGGTIPFLLISYVALLLVVVARFQNKLSGGARDALIAFEVLWPVGFLVFCVVGGYYLLFGSVMESERRERQRGPRAEQPASPIRPSHPSPHHRRHASLDEIELAAFSTTTSETATDRPIITVLDNPAQHQSRPPRPSSSAVVNRDGFATERTFV
ncbi:MAG: hypothetical protein M1833_002175 [Piccolia ochrophora]|nr:MAG: hypothetical protein M1833_002175 [Piccolia ochrophora]